MKICRLCESLGVEPSVTCFAREDIKTIKDMEL